MTETNSKPERAPVPQRAGTPLEGHGIPVRGSDQKIHGLIVRELGLYQGGGEVSQFVYWKERLLSFDALVWRTIQREGVKRIEMVDHEKGLCYRCAVRVAQEQGRWYHANPLAGKRDIGERYGVPMQFVTRDIPPPLPAAPVAPPVPPPQGTLF